MPNVIEFHEQRNDDDWRNRVQDLLKGGYGQFRFQKVDGSIRELMCTLRPDLFPESDWDADSNQAKPGLLVVWAPKEKGYMLQSPEHKKHGLLWENYPKNPNAFLLPIMSKKYLKEIGYKKLSKKDLKEIGK